VITVTVPSFAGQLVRAEVERLAEDDFVVIWCDQEAVLALNLSEERLAALIVRCELECLRLGAIGMLEAARRRDGIASLLDDTAPVFSSDRDARTLEVA
jgi:hypothetical protein